MVDVGGEEMVVGVVVETVVVVDTLVRAEIAVVDVVAHDEGIEVVVVDVDRLSKNKSVEAVGARVWYYALMDYGVYIKKQFGNPNSKSTHYTKQSTFKGSDREIRGAILKLLGTMSKTRSALLTELPFEDVRIDAQVENLLREGLIEQAQKKYQLPT